MSASSSPAQARLLGDDPHRQRPPRTLSALGQVRLLLGGGLSQAAWIIFILSSLIGWSFLQSTDVRALSFERAPLLGAPGTITEVWETSIVWNESIYGYRYEFSTPDGERRYQGVSYYGGLFMPGQAVAVEYRADNPADSRIRNMLQKPLGPGNLVWIAGLPLIGLLLIAYALHKGRRIIRLLTDGLLAPSRVVSNEHARFHSNDKPLYALTFGYVSETGEQHTIGLKTSDRSIAHDEQARCVIYNPDRPAEAAVIGSLPAPIEVDELGHVELGGPVRNLAVMVFPLIAMLVSGCLLASLVR